MPEILPSLHTLSYYRKSKHENKIVTNSYTIILKKEASDEDIKPKPAEISIS